LPKRSAAEEKRHQAELLKVRIVTRQRQLVHAAVVKAMLAGKGQVTRADLVLLVETFGEMPWHAAEGLLDLFPQRRSSWGGHVEDLEACSEAQLLALLTAAALHDELEPHERTKGARLYATAKRLKVDAKAIDAHAKELVEAETEHKERVRKWKGRAAATASSYEEPTCTRCGCTEEGGCTWIELSDKTGKGVCSACATDDEVAKVQAKALAGKRGKSAGASFKRR
jgi:hypothetical protein